MLVYNKQFIIQYARYEHKSAKQSIFVTYESYSSPVSSEMSLYFIRKFK